MSTRVRAIAAAAIALLLAACGSSIPTAPSATCPTAAPASADTAEILSGAEVAVVATNKGAFTITLDPSTSPVAVANFVQLARCGFYDGISFHRVIPAFVAQAGDPQTRDNRGVFDSLGTGGPGYRFDIELPDQSLTYKRYMVAMANAMQYDFSTGQITGGTDTNGSQFFVMLADAPTLRPYYSLLGEVTAGTDVVDAIGQVPTSGPPYDTPLDPVIIESIGITTASAAASPS